MVNSIYGSLCDKSQRSSLKRWLSFITAELLIPPKSKDGSS